MYLTAIMAKAFGQLPKVPFCLESLILKASSLTGDGQQNRGLALYLAILNQVRTTRPLLGHD